MRRADFPAGPGIDYEAEYNNRARVPEQSINQFDFLAVRTVHKTDDRPEFTHKPMFGSRQYSESFLEWLVGQARRDREFFADARRRYRSGMLSP